MEGKSCKMKIYISLFIFHVLGVVKVIRQEKRQGLMRSRMAGIRASSANVLVFLDSHIGKENY